MGKTWQSKIVHSRSNCQTHCIAKARGKTTSNGEACKEHVTKGSTEFISDIYTSGCFGKTVYLKLYFRLVYVR